MVISVNHQKGAESLVISLTITNALNLTLPVPIPDEEKKIKLIFYFSHFFVVAQKGFMKALKAYIKPFEAPQKKCENKN